MRRRWTGFATVLAVAAFLAGAVPGAGAGDWSAGIEGGLVWFSRNDVRIPGDGGTRFSLLDLTGTGPSGYVRGRVERSFGARHTLRLVAAPLTVRGTGTLAEPVRFEDADYAADTETRGVYRFDTYRLTYRYRLLDTSGWRLGLGAAVLVRSAEIRLTQGEIDQANTDLGFVPLLHLRLERRLGARTALVLDAEGLGGSQGRAVDVGLFAAHDVRPNITLSAGYRTLEGGADVSSVYAFAWLHFAALSAEVRF